MEIAQVTQAGECLLQLNIRRTARALNIWIQADAKVEDFFKQLRNGETVGLDEFGKPPMWVGEGLRLYKITDDLDSPDYTINAVGHSLYTGRGNPVNLSFLRFVGLSHPKGIEFSILGPAGKEYIRSISQGILNASRILFKDYIVPFEVNLRVVSTEL